MALEQINKVGTGALDVTYDNMAAGVDVNTHRTYTTAEMDVNEGLDTLTFGGLEQPKGTLHVDFNHRAIVRTTTIPGAMYDRINIFHELIKQIRLRQTAPDYLQIRAKLFGIQHSSVEQYAQVMALPDQARRHSFSQVAGETSQKNLHKTT